MADFDFAAYRDELRTGDLLAFSGKGMLHVGIRLWEWVVYRREYLASLKRPSRQEVGLLRWMFGMVPWLWQAFGSLPGHGIPKFSHVAMVLWINGQHPFVLEQELGGCRLVPLAWRLKQFNGEIWWYRLDQTRVDSQEMVEFGLKCVAVPYAYASLINVFLLGDRNYTSPGYCSILYRLLLKAGGYDWGDWDPMPDEVVELPVVSKVGRLVIPPNA